MPRIPIGEFTYINFPQVRTGDLSEEGKNTVMERLEEARGGSILEAMVDDGFDQWISVFSADGGSVLDRFQAGDSPFCILGDDTIVHLDKTGVSLKFRPLEKPSKHLNVNVKKNEV